MARIHLFIATVALALGPALFAQDTALTDYLQRRQQERQLEAPKLDPKRIINESNSFLREREPEMTAEEYALYEKVVTMLGTNADLALKLLEAMMHEDKAPSPAFELILGNAYHAAGRAKDAEKNFRSAVTRYPTFLRAWNNLGVLYYGESRFAEAVDCLSRCVSLGDRDPVTFGLLGYSLDRTGNAVAAEMAYMQAVAGDPTNADWKEGLLRIFVQGRQFGRAESLARSLMKEHPETTRFWFAYANILLAENRKLAATTMLEVAVGTGVGTTDETSLLGDLYAEQGFVDEALETYQRVLALSAPFGESKMLRYARMLTAAGRFEQATAVLLALPPTLSTTAAQERQLARADIHSAQKQWPAARRELDALLALAPTHGPALLRLGRTWAAEDDHARATFSFEAALQDRATTYDASLELANLALKDRQYAKAAEYLRKALAIEKTDAVEDYLAQIKTLIPSENG